mmetsp:Transcript_10144/g.29114  ORF Transcript_10144/g.29114 Transcript_10144/m.29114 type:complete len:202 (+) Transcript_10144:662-1267(+)
MSCGLYDPACASSPPSSSSPELESLSSQVFSGACSGWAAMASSASLDSIMSRRRIKIFWWISRSLALALATTSRLSTVSQNSVSPGVSEARVSLISCSCASSSRQLLPANILTISSCTAVWTPSWKADCAARSEAPLVASTLRSSSSSASQTTVMASQNSALGRSRFRCVSMSFCSSSMAGSVRPLKSLYGSVISTSLSSR